MTTVSDYCKQGLKYLTAKKIYVVPNFEPDFVFNYYKPLRKINKKVSICMINNGFTRLKNVSVGILAFKQFNAINPESELHLFGSSFSIGEEAYNWCTSRIELNNIFFHGGLPFDKLMNNLSEMDIFLHTSIEESFGMVLVEAMAMGIPVIAGENSGGPETILKDGGGLLVDVKSVDDVFKAMINLARSNFYSECSIKAREVALKRFSKEIVVNEYVKLYKSLFC